MIPDRIEAGTFLIAAGITGGDIRILGCDPLHLDALIAKLRDAGMRIDAAGDCHPGDGAGGTCGASMSRPFPIRDFPTDLQAQIMALMAVANGLAVITETVFENRFMHVSEMMRMGADIVIQGKSAIVRGVPKLRGAPVMATDLRASASLILAGLAAEGTTVLSRVYHIDRGYQQIEKKLSALGADIRQGFRDKAVEKRPSAAFPSSCAVQRTGKYASRLRISGALHLDIFEQPIQGIGLRGDHEDHQNGRARNLKGISSGSGSGAGPSIPNSGRPSGGSWMMSALRGDEALFEYTARWDGHAVTAATVEASAGGAEGCGGAGRSRKIWRSSAWPPGGSSGSTSGSARRGGRLRTKRGWSSASASFPWPGSASMRRGGWPAIPPRS